MRVLIIKLTSMGDLMHALPAITDAEKAYPDIEFDWVVDQGFAAVPLWHKRVKNVIKTAHRQWRKQPFAAWKDGRLAKFHRQLNHADYDVVIDLQSNLKSAFVSWLSKAKVHGLDKSCVREKPAHWAYDYHYSVNTRQHSIEKMRELMAQALDYDLTHTQADYGVDLSRHSLPSIDFDFSKPYLLFVHNASWLTKLWPVSSWQSLVNIAVEQGYSILLPCGSEEEYRRAQEIASINPEALALARLPLDDMAAITYHATAAVCSDTGLAHLAAVASLPAVTLYGATDPQLIGTYGDNQQHIISDFACAPCYKRQCRLEDAVNGEPVCMQDITAQQVWHRLSALLPAQ